MEQLGSPEDCRFFILEKTRWSSSVRRLSQPSSPPTSLLESSPAPPEAATQLPEFVADFLAAVVAGCGEEPRDPLPFGDHPHAVDEPRNALVIPMETRMWVIAKPSYHVRTQALVLKTRWTPQVPGRACGRGALGLTSCRELADNRLSIVDNRLSCCAASVPKVPQGMIIDCHLMTID
ncbi:unnamed protein product [Cuscuta campestris]|uniref:Uncharacterized protein n=1 Tax=Cuscuta campestris TaxID=132261 RepID=A0A484MQB4_9ASTE|nr:unnamed protein product [Cuscuta campestris]